MKLSPAMKASWVEWCRVVDEFDVRSIICFSYVVDHRPEDGGDHARIRAAIEKFPLQLKAALRRLGYRGRALIKLETRHPKSNASSIHFHAAFDQRLSEELETKLKSWYLKKIKRSRSAHPHSDRLAFKYQALAEGEFAHQTLDEAQYYVRRYLAKQRKYYPTGGGRKRLVDILNMTRKVGEVIRFWHAYDLSTDNSERHANALPEEGELGCLSKSPQNQAEIPVNLVNFKPRLIRLDRYRPPAGTVFPMNSRESVLRSFQKLEKIKKVRRLKAEKCETSN